MDKDKIMEISELTPYLKEIKMLSSLVVQKGWTEKNAGNFSIRLDALPKGIVSSFSEEETNLETHVPSLEKIVFLVKGKGQKFRDLAIDPSSGCGLIKITNKGKSYQCLRLDNNKSAFLPTSELLSHLLLQEHLIKAKPEYKAILHTHPLEIIIFSHLMKELKSPELNKILASMHVEIPILLPEGVGFIPFFEPGSLELAKASKRAMKQFSIIVWERHGCLAFGNELLDAFDSIDLINKAASIYIGLNK
jgi:rhamnulose-1-phosphate aldolase